MRNKSAKVVIVTNIPSPYRVDLYYYMQQNYREYEWYVIYTNKNEDNREWTINYRKLTKSFILNARILKIRGKNDNHYIHMPTNIGKKLKELLPDVVIAFEYNPAALQCLIWCKRYNKKFIHLTDGTLYSERFIGKVQKLVRKIIIAHADAYIASSTRAKEKLLSWKAPKEKIFTCMLTVNVDVYKNIIRKPNKGRILYVGSMVYRKGLDLLIQALPFIKDDFNLHIVGNGTKKELQDLYLKAEKYKISEKIKWCGFKEGIELQEEYAQAEVFVMPTREDCFGLVLIEAASANVPIVVSKYADGAYDIVSQGDNGYIIDPNCPKEFADAIQKVFNDAEIGKRAERVNLEKFEYDHVVHGYIDAVSCAMK